MLASRPIFEARIFQNNRDLAKHVGEGYRGRESCQKEKPSWRNFYARQWVASEEANGLGFWIISQIQRKFGRLLSSILIWFLEDSAVYNCVFLVSLNCGFLCFEVGWDLGDGAIFLILFLTV
ncbi:hypothetical protein U1Q18_006060 [Sarracenia purpurea var. burkii]